MMTERIFDNRYVVDKLIGKGGMAEVFQAHDDRLDRTVAVKVMRPELAKETSFFERFHNEARAAAQLTSPHVVSVYDWGQDGDDCYIVMEYVRGINLREALRKHGAIHPWKVAEIGSQVCAALQEAHSHGIYHRDIKPSNLMIQASGDVKIMDFGIAQSERHQLSEGDELILGTAHYMSPEQISGNAGAQSDLYSLGIVMYELCTARLPFSGRDANEVVNLQLHGRPIPPAHLCKSVDMDLNGIILQALEKDLATRIQSAASMREMLDDYLTTEKHNPCPLPYPEFWVAAVIGGNPDLIGQMYKIDKPCSIGRGKDSDIRIPDQTVSSTHARITPRGRYLDIEDLKSSNGTIVNGTRIQAKTLCQAGSNIDLGAVRLRLGQKM